MLKLGKILHVTSNGFIIVLIKNIPAIGAKVVDKRMKKIGVVFDIIGPTNRPFAVIKPFSKIDMSSLDPVLYCISKEKKRKIKRRGKSLKKK